MKLSSYIVAIDAGLAPNPFGRHCTLACCKPMIRRNAEVGDIIVGTGSTRNGLDGRLVYAMRVREILPIHRYWTDPRFRYKRPSPTTAAKKVGDNIWRREQGCWRLAAHAGHRPSDERRDVGGRNVLVATEFFYFGRAAIPVPARFKKILATTQGHKNIRDEHLTAEFWRWIAHKVGRRGLIDLPADFAEEECVDARRGVLLQCG